uniref:Glutamate-rich protein 3-like isoform X9 n=1 Tax=Crassostrea virginica TaxID=6565 RepID=A0A8B8D2K3_CRAVI|nr:glutamate-rich protein 3-like isoform X9 [Crassostrea virginica]
MSHVYEGPLATYNSLTDRNLSGYFSNTRMRRHLRKAGLVNKRGELVSENQYRLNMARKEHKKHVKDMLAQAIVHKSLDMERTRQVEIRRKLEEIAKIELVRRVRSSRGRKGDEEILPYLSPRSSRSASRPDTANQQRYRPQSAPSGKHYDNDIVYVDEHGRQLSPEGREEFRTTKARPQDIDTKHLYALDSAALRKYALHLSRIEQESMSPYLYSPVPTPPRSQRGNRVGSRPQIRSRPRTAEPHRSSSPREKKSAHSSEKSSERSYSVNSERENSPKGTPARGLRNGQPRRPLNRPRVVEGSLMLHRQEPAMMHQGEVQTLCEITMKYHGPNLTLPRDQYDPTQNVTIDQQHCGGNTLPVFRENLKPGEIFSFISRRHRGYPFSLSIFVDGRVDSRVSTCCEYKHAKGVKLGGKMGHFSLLKVEGATPCYKCKLTTKASPRSLKRPPKTQKQPEQLREEVIVVDRRHVQERYSCDVNKSAEKESPKQKEEVKDEVISPEEAAEYSDDADFDDEEEEKKDEEKERPESVSSKSSRSSSRSSRSPSPSHHSSSSDEEADRNAVSHFVYENKKTKVIGLAADEDNRTEKTETDKDSVSDIRKVAGYSDEEEYPDGEKYSKEQNAATKVKPEREQFSRRRSISSSSSSSSSRSRSRTPERVIVAQTLSPDRSPSPQEKRKSPSPELKRKSPSPEPARVSPSPERRSPSPVRRSSTSSSSSTSSVHVSEPEEKESTTEKVLLAKSRELDSQPSPQKSFTRKDSVPLEFNYTSYSESIADSDVGKPIAEEPTRPTSPLPEEFEYRKKFEDTTTKKPLTKSFRKGSTSSSSSSDGGKRQFPTSTVTAKKDYSSSESEDDRKEKEKLKTSDAKDTKEKKSSSESDSDSTAAKKRTFSNSVSKGKSSSSDSDSENEKKRALKQKEMMVSKTTKSSSSSSSGTSSESEKEKKVPTPPRKSPSPPVVAQSMKKSSSSSSSSSSSESETDTARSETEKSEKRIPLTKEQEDEPPQKQSAPLPPLEPIKQVKKSSSSSSSSSDSSSESESETEASKPPVKPPSPAEQKKTEPSVTEEDKKPKPNIGEAKSAISSSSSGSSSSDSSETETDRSEKPIATKVPTPPSEPKTIPAVIENVEKKPEPVQESKKDDSSGSEDSSSDSDSSSSDSESEDGKEKKAPEEKLNEKEPNNAGKTSEKQADLPISESDTDKKISIFNSDTDGDNMHGGNDPDEVEAGGIGGTSYLSRIGVKQGTPIDGSVVPMFEGKADIDLNSIALSNEQVSEISGYLTEKENVKTFSLRNANLDCDKFEKIVSALKRTKSEIQMVNLNLNKLNATSAKEISELLVEKPALQILLLHGNPLGDIGIKYITDSLQDVHNAYLSHKDEEDPPSYCQLQELDLGDTLIGDEGIEQISTLLEANTSLKTLNLNGNTRITASGWKRLGKALRKNTSLETLTLDFNKIGDEGVACIVSGLKDNQTLRVLELEEGSISDEGGKKLVELLKCNTTILDITVSPGNAISDKTRGEILNYLGLNKAAAQPKST